MAGVLGLEPWTFTLRELDYLFEGRIHERWNHTSSMMALTANCHRGKNSKDYQSADFHPLVERTRGIKLKADNIEILKMFIPKENRGGEDGET
jgi:hypothetical protein